MATYTADLQKKWTLDYPELGTGPVPIEPCILPEYFELERERIFKHSWLNVGRVEEIANPGDYLVKDIDICETSILVTRASDGALRAFHNICPHRGNKLVWSDGGSRKAFTCNFHGWSFNPKGELIGAPDKANFFDFEKCSTDLKKVSVDTWEGFLFVNMDEQPAQSLKEYLGEFGERLHGYPFDSFPTCFAYRATVNVNWKVAIDAFQEAYHAGILHKKSIPSFTARENPYNHPLWIKLYKNGHRTFSVYGNTDYKTTPVEQMAVKYGTVISSALAGRSADDSLRWGGMNPTKSDKWGFDINVVFPNFFVDVLEGTYFTYNFWPVAVDRMIWDVRMYYPKAQNASQRFSQEYSKVALRDTLLEDLGTLEQSQQMLRSGAIKSFLLSDGEIAVRHQHKYIEDVIGFYRTPDLKVNGSEGN